MPYPHDLRAPTNPFSPEPVGFCERCSFKYPLAQLLWQTQQIGLTVRNIRLRVCPRCLDEPSPFLAPPIIRGPEGVVRDPRPFIYDSTYFATGPSPPTPEAIEGPPDVGPIYMIGDDGELLTDDLGRPLTVEPGLGG